MLGKISFCIMRFTESPSETLEVVKTLIEKVDLKRDDVIIYLVSKGANVNIENSKVKWPYEDTRSQISKIS
ncbi:hypothetical protein N7522_012714 [Penicillium canescens]|nr:hypothetical protein N7522_012714 [Penicillium canescens]KAJ6158529.1 hypothetical protein N7485_011355 [Penicillium canescens]